MLFIQVTAPPGAAAERTQRVLDGINDYLQKDEASNVQGVLEVQASASAAVGRTPAWCS